MSSIARRPTRLDASPETLQRDLGRLHGDLGELIQSLDSAYAPRWKFDERVSALTTRPMLRFGRLRLIDTRDGTARLYLPRARTVDAGLAVGFLKQIPSGAIALQPTDGSLVNGLTTLENLTQVGFHYAIWDGTAWWVREPAARVQAHSTSFQPLGLWQMTQRSLVDSSGNSRTLAVETGTERYTYLSGTLGGFYGDGSTALWYNTADAALRLTGDMTFECLFVLETVTAGAYWFSHTASGETEATNQLYGLAYNSVSSPAIAWIQENGAGVNSTYSGPSYFMFPGQLVHMAITRISNVIQPYLNGRVFGTASSALTTPTGGGDGRFRLFGDAATRIRGVMASAKLIGSGLTAAQIMTERNYCLGGAQGYIDDYG